MSKIVDELDPLFNPRSIAVIGATNNANKWGHSTLSSVLSGFNGKVYPINLKEDEILGCKAYKNIKDVPDDVDLSIFVIPAERISPVMTDCVEKGVKASIIISAGFRETGKEGRRLEDEILSITRNGGLRFVGPNCMGMWSAPPNLRAYMFPLPTIDGPIGFVTQGGNVGAAVVVSAFGRGIGFRRYVSCGPAADIQIEDYIEYFGEDPNIKVVLAYIEGLGDGKRFIEKVSQVSKKKPVIALKPGKTEAGAHAIISHSGAIAGTDDVYEAAFREAGVLRVGTPEELLDVAIGFLTQPLPRGRNVAIITGGGSYGVICAEYCETLGLNVVDLPEETISDFSKIFPPRWSHGNPVDPAGDRNLFAYYAAPEMVLRLDEIDSLIFMGFGSISGFATMMSSGDKRGASGPISSALSSLTNRDELFNGINELRDALESVDLSRAKSLIRPAVPFIASAFSSSEEIVERLFTKIISGEISRAALEDFMSAVPNIGENGGLGPNEILVKLDSLVSAILFQLMKTTKKPIISTTFSDTAPRLMGASYSYPTADKATKTLIKLVEYREYLERKNAFEDPLGYCSILNSEFK